MPKSPFEQRFKRSFMRRFRWMGSLSMRIMMLGLLCIVVSIFADSLGLGDSPGLGKGQVIGMGLGVGLAFLGLMAATSR